jgi:hypothetical protein
MKLSLESLLVLACATAPLSSGAAQLPNLRVTGIRIVDANDKPINPIAGQPFFVEIDWSYSNPVCTSYTLTDAQDNLDLVLYRDGQVVAQSRSVVDTVEHLDLTGLQPGAYEFKVERLSVPNSGDSEPYGLAWHSTVLWTNQPPVLGSLSASLASAGIALFQFKLLSGQAGNFELQGAADLSHPVSWTVPSNATLTQTGSDTFQFQLPLDTSPTRFFRIQASP